MTALPRFQYFQTSVLSPRVNMLPGVNCSHTPGGREGSEGARRGAPGRRGGRGRRQFQRNGDSGRLQQGGQQGGQRARPAVQFGGPFPSDPCVAIIGGGLSGLVCAIELAERGVRSVVFDTGDHGVGGRLGTRSAEDGSLPSAPPGTPHRLVFDHAAQFFTASSPAFQRMVERWEKEGAVRRWEGRVGELQRGGSFRELDDPQPRYIATNGMRSLAQHLASCALRVGKGGAAGGHPAPSANPGLVEVRRPQWVSDMVPREGEGGWRLVGKGREQGNFDAVVIAHNGKCANRLTQPARIPQVHGQLKRLKLSANWVVMVAFAGPLPLPTPFEGAFITGSDSLSWAANNSAKLGVGGGVECWTLISTQQYGRQNKVPQENVPLEVRDRVAQDLLAELAACLGLEGVSRLPGVVYCRVQLWGAALPLNTPATPCIWDPLARAGVCGDWVHSGGSMQAAALSGLAMAESIAGTRGLPPHQAAQQAQGLAHPFTPVAGTPIGEFPAAHAAHAAQGAGGVQGKEEGSKRLQAEASRR